MPNDLGIINKRATTTSMVPIWMTNRTQCSQVSLIIRLDMLWIDRCQVKSIATSHCSNALNLTAETAHFLKLFIWTALTLSIVAVKLVLLLRENWVADWELMKMIEWIISLVLMVEYCPLLDCFASFLELLLAFYFGFDVWAGKGRYEAWRIIQLTSTSAHTWWLNSNSVLILMPLLLCNDTRDDPCSFVLLHLSSGYILSDLIN